MPVPAPDDVDVRLARVRGQWLDRYRSVTPVDVVERLLAVQAQDLKGARLAVRARSTVDRIDEVDAAFATRELVVGWLNRGTLHLVRREDYRWLHALVAERSRVAVARRLQQEGVSPAQAELGVRTVVEAIRAQGPRTRGQLKTALDEAGVPTAGQALVHVLFWTSLDGTLLRGPVVGHEQAFVLADDWLGPAPGLPDRDELLARLARRYRAGHAAATAEDLAGWAGITLGDARRGWAAAGKAPDDEAPDDEAPDDEAHPDLPGVSVDVDDLQPRLLGPFDPVLHGWPDRAWVLDGHTQLVTVNGIFKASALVRGRVVGTWTVPGGHVKLELFEDVDDGARAALADEAARVEHFLAGTVTDGPRRVAQP